MKKMYVTVTGMNHYFGMLPFYVGQKLKCYKEPNNPVDEEAIRVEIKGMGKAGYIANSVYTCAKGTYSAGRVYERVEEIFKVKVLFITSGRIICEVI